MCTTNIMHMLAFLIWLVLCFVCFIIATENPHQLFDSIAKIWNSFEWFYDYGYKYGYNDIMMGERLLGDKKLITNAEDVSTSTVSFLYDTKITSGVVIDINQDTKHFAVISVAHDYYTLDALNLFHFKTVWRVITMVLFAMFVSSCSPMGGREQFYGFSSACVGLYLVFLSQFLVQLLIQSGQIEVYREQFNSIDDSLSAADQLALLSYKYGLIGDCEQYVASYWYDYILWNCIAQGEDGVAILSRLRALTPDIDAARQIEDGEDSLSVVAISSTMYEHDQNQHFIDMSRSWYFVPILSSLDKRGIKYLFEDNKWYHVEGKVTSHCENEWHQIFLGCDISMKTPVSIGMSGAACQVNDKFVGLVGSEGTIFNVYNRCVSFASSSFEKNYAAWKSDKEKRQKTSTRKQKDEL